MEFFIQYPNSASVADAMAFLTIIHYTCTGLFYGVIAVIGVFLCILVQGNNPPALLRDSGSEIYDAYEYMCIIILLLLYYVTVSGCNAL